MERWLSATKTWPSTMGQNFAFCSLLLLSQVLSTTSGLECYRCGVKAIESRPQLPGSQLSTTTTTQPTVASTEAVKVPTCNFFNQSLPLFRETCRPEEKGCLKGWLSQAPNPAVDDGVVRSCTKIQDNICMNQNGGGACSCSTDLCNGGHQNGQHLLFILLLNNIILVLIL